MKKFIYIDDESDSKVQALINGINRHGEVTIEHFQSMTFDKFVSFMEANLKNYQGILLDLRLDDKANDEGERANYTAPVVAQYLRTLATDGKIQDIPIVLCSTDERLKKIYNNDLTSHNLFDMRFSKDDTDRYECLAQQLEAVASGYETISKESDIGKLIGIDLSKLDERIFSRFLTDESFPAHEKAQFILKELIFVTGPLIDEKVLASRLGIHIETSSDWPKVKDGIFSDATYQGVFAGGWERWWMHEIDTIFNHLTGTYLSYLDADERVKVLKEKTGIENLEAAKAGKYCHSNRFWTVCACTGEPIDPIESFRVATDKEPKIWQEYRYLAPHSALERLCMEKGKKVHFMDQDRLHNLQQKLES
ncbi:MAG: hypothetical protein AB7U26_03095 [Sulfuricurvum sp.]